MSEQTMYNHARAVKIVTDWWERWGGIPHGTYAEGSLRDLTNRITDALSPPTPPPDKVDRWCVIGVDAYERRWFPTLDEAIEQSRTLFEKQKAAKIMIAVKAERVIERTPPPPVHSREPVATDFLSAFEKRRHPLV